MFDTLDDEMKAKLEQDFKTFKVCKLSNASGGARMLVLGFPPEYVKESIIQVCKKNDIIVEFLQIPV